MTTERIPVTVIGGYLGAGKTTLINALLAGDHGRRLAVLVNDFGAINIDAALINRHDGDTISLSNGCVCCTIADALGDALDNVLAMSPTPDHVVIEASGVANPAKIAMYGQGWPGLCLDGIVVMADGDNILTRADDKFVGTTVRQQISAADLLILNKTDLISAERQFMLRSWLEVRAPDAKMISAAHGNVPPEILLGQIRPHEARQRVLPQEHDHYSQISFQSDQPFDHERLRSQIQSWPASILRAKGVVYLRENPAHTYILQVVGRRCTIERGQSWDGGKPQSQVVVIGANVDFDPAWLQKSLRSACS